MISRHRKKTKRKEVFISNHEVDYGDLKLEYKLIRCDRASYEIQIKPGGEIVVRAPYQLPHSMVIDFFMKKEQWIRKKYFEQSKLNPGKKYQKDEKDRLLEKRYKKAAADYIPQRVGYYAGLIGVTYEKITIRDTKTRWGSCSSSGNLSFSWRLMLAPFSVLDYVVVHELCHRIHMNHSKEFWNTVGLYFPDYKEKKNWLREKGRFLGMAEKKEE